MSGHTPGPWRWEVNRKHKTVQLCGGPPKRGFGRYDLTVLSFRRYGMNGAAPVFWNWDMERYVGKPERADELAIHVNGREHHADWFADVDHPDARLIAAAPELLEALCKAIKWLAVTDDPRCTKDLHAAEEAVRKARGQ
jgi:hypothetical protein